ncbi:hypothetical protein [Nocardioides sp. Leaf285]|uniref:hypothetical protein n=1 Tax=Nocardioides sp. Leaf285 TaxID=1736322 RepID=UPI000A883833|nr:hypothetical protein [Nocardioides sp. Leaf285]
MSYPPSIHRDDARQVVADRVARANERHLPTVPRRRRLARGLRRVADALDA